MPNQQQHRLIEADCQLHLLKINNTDTGYDSLKKGKANIAVCRFVEEEDSYLLGIKSQFVVEEIREILKGQKYLNNQCPSLYISKFSPIKGVQGRDWPHESYQWWFCSPKQLVISVFNQLDTRLSTFTD